MAALVRVLGAVLFLGGSSLSLAQDAASCLECHSLPDQELQFRSGESRSVTIDRAGWDASVHGAGGLDCTACHTEHAEYPHAEVKDDSVRAYALTQSRACEACHEDQVRQFADGVHHAMHEAGNAKPAVCADCHDPHAGRRLTDPDRGTLLPEARRAIPLTCARCHAPIYEQYKASAHGAALLGDGNPDVPTCIDCHGVHRISDPRTARFRVNSPRICASCHTDAAKMARYSLSTAVLETYVADFHGSTVTLFQKSRPDQETNKPVCYDCHGVHDIPHTRDPDKGIRTKANLLRTCQQCHPGATGNFPDAWMSHFIPDRERTPTVYWVGWLYKILIPLTVGGMLLFVGTDFVRRRIDLARPARESETPAEEPKQPEDPKA
jgi:hypothetical protein